MSAIATMYEDALADKETEIADLHKHVLDWIAANSPGGWIDDLRSEVERLNTALSLVRQYPDFDAGGPLVDMMDQVLAGRPSPMLDALDNLRGSDWNPIYAAPVPRGE